MAIKKTIELESNISKITKDVDGLASSFEGVADSVADIDKEIEKTNKSVEDIGKTSKGASKDIKGIAKGFKGVGLAIKAAGIGLVISLFGALKEVMMQNQVVADLFAKVFETVSIVFNAIVQALVDAVKNTAEATGGFDALGKVLNGILTLTLTPMKLAFYGIQLAIQEAMLAWENSFFGDNDPESINKLNEAIKETKDNLVEVVDEAIEAGSDIVTNFGEAVGEVGTLTKNVSKELEKSGEKVKNAWDAAGNIVELKKRLEEAKAANEGLIESYDVQAEKQRQIRDDERKSITERIEANNKLGEILIEQNDKMKANAQIAVQLAELEYQKNNSVENGVALQRAKNELVAIEARVEGYKSEQLINQMSLERERQEIKQTGVDAELEAIKIVEEAKLSTNKNELERLREAQRLREEDFNKRNEDIQARLEKMAEDGSIETQMYADLLAQKRGLDAEYEAATIMSKQEIADKELEIEQKKTDAINGLAAQGFQVLNAFAEQGSLVGKRLAQAQIIFDTYKAIQATFATASANPASILFPAFPYIQAGLAATFGAAQLRGLESEQAPSGSVSSGGSVAGSVVRPDINVVQANNANGTLNSINNNANRPIRAYVTSGDVQSSQALERNTITSAKLGG